MQNPRRSRPEPIQNSIRSFLREHSLGSRGSNGAVFRAWNDCVAEQYQGRTTPVRFRNSVLTIEVDSSVHLHELKSFRGEGFRQATNQALGSQVVRRVVFKLRG